ncbi:TniQ family protein [Paracoccus sp. 228]|uniref:TniQ family protein n=1 Tax=Paracoccus sp. 228 TaxID=1192054 RepID=UPI000A05D426|nr:TniQ family protein [Paracoccus sp. 228]|tara:strand:+ start:2080 stop:3933 length:1854 start_codon:yes stop_codon:yes gene_type:complete
MFGRLARLPLTVDMVPGESATSLGSRLARRNGVQRLITFCSDVGIDYFALANGDPHEVARLAALAGVNPGCLQKGTPQLIEPGWFRLGKERIKFTAFSRTSLRSCPACLKAGLHVYHSGHHGLWQLTSVRTCPVHGCYLVPLPPRQNGNDTFDIMRMLEEYVPVAPAPARADDLELERYLRQRVQTGAGEGWLGRLPFHVAAQTCEGFGLLLTHGADAKRDLVAPAEWAAAGTAGFRVLREGPDAFRARLKNIQIAQPLDNTLYRTRFRVFFEWLRYRDDDPDFDIIRDIVREFVFRNFPIAKGQVVLGQPCPEQYVHSLATARNTFGISGWKLGRRLSAIGLAQRSSVSKRFVLNEYAPADVVRGIVTEVDALLNATEAAHRVGIDRMMITKFTDRGLIPKYYPDHNAAPLYHPRDLEAFLGRLRSLAASKTPSEQHLDIPTASRWLSVPTDRVTRIILDHRVPLFANETKAARFRDFRVSVPDLQQEIYRAQDGVLRPADAAKVLGISVRTVRSLLDRGILEPRTVREERSARNRRYVSISSIETFAAEYITVVDLASQSGRLPGAEAILQTDRGVQPLDLDSRCNMIFKRADVPALSASTVSNVKASRRAFSNG